MLTRIAREMGFQTALVNAEHVVKMRTVVFGDSGKTDRRDPHAIAAVADRGRLIIDRVLPEVFQLLRGWSSIYQIAENGLIEAKGRVHRALKYLFPDFDFSADFLYGPSGQAIMSCYRFDPHRIATESPSRMFNRLRRRCRILRSSVCRLLAQARSSAGSTPNGALNELAVEHLRLAWQDYSTPLSPSRTGAGKARAAICGGATIRVCPKQCIASSPQPVWRGCSRSSDRSAIFDPGDRSSVWQD